MNEPLSLAYWEALRLLAEPLELMKFTLTYDGDLHSTGNKSQPAYVSRLRNEFHDQLADLWDSHVVLRQLARTARVHHKGAQDIALAGGVPKLPDYRGPIPPLRPGYIDLCAAIEVNGVGGFIPLVRDSLNLACELDIQFLRHEDPGSLVFQGGDLDGRIKTLFDALRMPSEIEAKNGETPTANPLYCVLQSDTLISDFSVKTGRLLGERAKKPHTVRLWIDVTIKVLRVTEHNQSLMGG